MTLALAIHALTALVLLWNVFLAGQIAQKRDAPRVFVALSAIVGLLVAPALFVDVVGASAIFGRSIVDVAWIWPAVCVLFALQALYATWRGLVSRFLGVPIAAWDVLLAVAAVVRYAENAGWPIPTIAAAFPAAQAAVVGVVTGTAALWSPLAVAMPLLSPAFPARWRLSKTVRVTLAGYAAAAAVLFALELVRGVRAVTSYERYASERLRERPRGDFAVGLRLFPDLDDPPPPIAVRNDLALVDSAGVRVLMVVVEPAGSRLAALDSLARSLETRRSDSTALIVAMGYDPGDRERYRRDPGGYFAGRLDDLDRVVRRLRPDILLPADEPYGAGARALGRLAPNVWARYLAQAAARARRVRPRTRVAVAASIYDARDSVLFAWAASPGSPIDAVGFTLYPSFGGAVSLDARMHAADRWLRAAPTTKDVWVFATGGFPAAHGEPSQERAIWGTLVWATSHDAVKGVVVADAADYAGPTGLRAPGGRIRPAAAVLERAIRSLRENEGQ